MGIRMVCVAGILAVLSMIATGNLVAEEHEAPKADPALKSTADLDAAEPGSAAWMFAADAALVSKYVWRGQNVTDGLVMQPNISVGYEGLSLSVWGNWDWDNVNARAGDITELNYTLDYTFDVDFVSVSTGYIYYDFPGGGPDTQELYVGLSFDAPLDPSVTCYWDIDQANGAYIAFAIGHSFEEVVRFDDTSAMGVDLGLSLGLGSKSYNMAYFGENGTAFNDLTLTVGLPISLGGNVTVTPNLNFSTLLNNGIRRGAQLDDNVYGGVTVSVAF